MIAPLNEPAGFRNEMIPTIKQFYYDSYGNIRFPYGSSRKVNLSDSRLMHVRD